MATENPRDNMHAQAGYGVDPEPPVPDDLVWTDAARQRERSARPVRDWICLVVAQQTCVSLRGTSTIFHTQMPEGVISEFYEVNGMKPAALPAGAVLHVRSSRLSDIEKPEQIVQVTLPYGARVTKKLGKGSWRAENTTSGETFEFSETSDRFAVAGPDWPKVGAEITYHQSPTEKFAIMAKQKPYMLVSGHQYNMCLPHDAAIPTPEEIAQMESKGRSRSDPNPVGYVFGMLALAGVMAIGPTVERVGRAVGLITHRYEPRTGFYLPDGFGMKPE